MKKSDETKSKLASCKTEELLALWNERGDKPLKEDTVMAIIDLLHERGEDIPEDLLFYKPPEQEKRYIWFIVVYAVGNVISKQFPDSIVLKIISTFVFGAIIGYLIGLIPKHLFKSVSESKIKKFSPLLCALSGAMLGIIGAGVMALFLLVLLVDCFLINISIS